MTQSKALTFFVSCLVMPSLLYSTPECRVSARKLIEKSIDFTEYTPGSFTMGPTGKSVQTTLTKPFEIMSAPTSRDAYKIITEMLHKHSPAAYSKLDPDPSHINPKQTAVDTVSYEDVQLWIRGLNELSRSDDTNIQNTLNQFFPGHERGKSYRLPTEAEWEYAAKPTRNIEKPIYDIPGRVWEWTQDWYDSALSGGTDPQGPASGVKRVTRGGNWLQSDSPARTSFRFGVAPNIRANIIGFRLVRS